MLTDREEESTAAPLFFLLACASFLCNVDLECSTTTRSKQKQLHLVPDCLLTHRSVTLGEKKPEGRD
ncbi:hypothetical protein ILYODFUR_032574 [Ilyodon furcidens]|uniref:Secreted protein n=1 Tax=Ilyodon furcidens TaxID=33524 RepID=A0ABV0UKX3_9TELE